MQSLVLFQVGLEGIELLVVNTKVLEFHNLHDAFWCWIHCIIYYFDFSSIRASSYDVYVLVWMIGWGSSEFQNDVGVFWLALGIAGAAELAFVKVFSHLQCPHLRWFYCICDGEGRGTAWGTLQLRGRWSHLR